MPDRERAARRLLAVTEEELQRLILDIHDGPVQKVFAALSQLSWLRTRLEEYPETRPDLLASLDRSVGLLESALEDIRHLLSTFRAPEFTQRELSDILEDLIVQIETLTGLNVHLTIEPIPVAVAFPVKIALYRITQEALANVYRHAGVHEAEVSLRRQGQRLRLEVRDRGRGFIPPPLSGEHATERSEHIGLRGMRERAELVNGELWVESSPGRGTCVCVEVPLYE
jgi:signal transduction histidine kinase